MVLYDVISELQFPFLNLLETFVQKRFSGSIPCLQSQESEVGNASLTVTDYVSRI